MGTNVITTSQRFNVKRLEILLQYEDKIDRDNLAILNYIKKYSKKRGALFGKLNITYKTKDKALYGLTGFGRYYGTKGSLETIRSDIRGYLLNGFYSDVDIVNCHPVLFYQFAKASYNLDMPIMKRIAIDRDQFLKDLGKNKEEFKAYLYPILYNGIKELNGHPKFVSDLINEMNQLYTFIINDSKYEPIIKMCKNEKANEIGSLVSHVIQHEEKKCLLAMIDKFTELGYSVDILAHDGCCVRKNTDATDCAVSDDVLEQVQEHLKITTGYSVKLTIKPFNDKIEGFDPVDDTRTYASMKKKWEENHFHFKPSDTIVEIKEHKIEHYKISNAKSVFNTHEWIINDSEGKNSPFINKWITDPYRRVVDRLVYKMPGECLPNEASIYTGMDWEDIDPVDLDENEIKRSIEFFNDFTLSVCGDNQESAVYVIKYMAHIIQNPFKKTGVSNIFSSALQGSGKDTWMTIISNIVGKHNVAHYTTTDQFFNPYDTIKEGAIIIWLEEACSTANKKNEDALKGLITGNDIVINPKNTKPYMIQNVANIFMTTNNAEPVKIDETDRRFNLMNPGDRYHKADEWVNILKSIATDEWIYGIGSYLKSIDLTDFNVRKFPSSTTRNAYISEAKTVEERFLMQWKGKDGGQTGGELYNEYVNFCSDNGYSHALSSLSFCKKIIHFNGKYYKTKVDNHLNRKLYFLAEIKS